MTYDEYIAKRKKEQFTYDDFLEKYNIKEKNSEYNTENSSSNKWFKADLFNDGYQFGDISKTVGATVGDIGVDITKGIMNIGEGIGDLLTYGQAQIYDWKGNSERANELRKNAQENLIDKAFNPVDEYLDRGSVLGEKADNIVEGIGYVVGMTAISIASGGAGTGLGMSETAAATLGSTITTFSTAMGNGMTEAYKDGASNNEAWLYGFISGIGEAGSELMFGGLGKASSAIGFSKGVGELDDKIIGSLTKPIKNKMVKTLTQYGLKAAGEGVEEVASGFVSALGKKVTYMKDEDFKKILKDENLAEQFWMGTLTSALVQAPSGVKSVAHGTDYISGRTSNEQKVYDTLLENKSNELKTQKALDNMIDKRQSILKEMYGRELTQDEINEIKETINEVKNTGKLDITNTKLSYKEQVKLQEEIENDLIEGNLSPETIRDILGEDTDISKDSLLQKSLYEDAQKYEDFKFEATNNEKVNVLLQSAADSGFNNTTKAHRRIELIAKLVENTDRQYRFISQEQLEEKGYNKNANGLEDNGEILLNINSKKEIVAVVGHETTHLFDSKVQGEYTQEYKDLQSAVIDFLKTNGTYEAKIKEITDTYSKAGEELTKEQILREVTADTIGDNLFGENAEEFIKHLTANRNVFQKIYDYIKKAVRNIKGYRTEEARKLQNLKDAFDRVYKTLDTKTDTDTEVKYSIGGEKAIENIKNSKAYKKAIDSLNEAKKLKAEGKTNEEIKHTGWYQDQAGDWKFEFSDKDMELKKKNLILNYEYNLSEVLDHSLLYDFYPELANTKVIFEKRSGSAFSREGNTIFVSSNKIGNDIQLKATLIHEIQHAIQSYENHAHGSSIKNGLLRYYNTLGEIEAADTKQRYLNDMNGKPNSILPETAKNNPTHQNVKDGNILVKLADGVYNYFHKGKKNVFKNKEIMEENENKNRSLVDERGRVSYSISQDNQGRTLSKEQQEYFKDSKALNDNGELETVYHTTTDNVSQFNEFNPVDTPYYRFGKQIVNYYTDSKDMSGSYANNHYEMADTKRLNNLDEARQWIKEQNTVLDEYTIKKETDKKNNIFYGLYNNDRPIVGLYFNNETELLRNLKQRFNDYKDQFGYNKSKLQYEGYVNIKNPYIIDAEGKNWDSVVSKLNKEVENEIKEIKKDTKTVTDLINLQIESEEKHNQYLNQGIEEYSGQEEYNLVNDLVKDLGRGQSKEFKSVLEDTFWFGFNYNDYIQEYAKEGIDLPDGNTKVKDIIIKYTEEHDSNDIKRIYEKLNNYGNMSLNDFQKKAYEVFKKNLQFGKEGSYFENNYYNIIGKHYDSSSIITPNQLYKLAQNGFSKESVLDILGERQTTNDIVKQVLEMNKNGANYDGIIMKNVLDYGGNSKTRQPANLYVTFASNQFKAYDNTNPTEDSDIRYSMTEGETDQYWKKQIKNSEESSFNLDSEVGNYETKTVEDVLNETPEEKQKSMKDKAKKYISRSRTNFINNIVENFGTSKIANTNTLNNITEQIKEDVQKNEKLTKEQKDNYFNELYNNLVKIDTQFYDEYKSVKDNIRNTKLYISDNIRNDITDFGEFRKSNMNNIIMTNDNSNIAVDEYYKELSEMNPELFPSDIVNPTEQLLRISDVVKDIKKVETNVAAYNDANLGKDYRYWARETFDKDLDKFVNDIKMAERYNNESNIQDKIGMTKDLVKLAYAQLPEARKKYEKVNAKEVLTKEDRVQVDRLLKNEITAQEIPEGLNKEGIIRLATAKSEYDMLQKSIKEYQLQIKQNRIDQAKNDIGNLDLWKDKKIGFKFSRETPIRNIYDVAPKGVADNIVNKYFRPYIETHEKIIVDETNRYFDIIRDLDLGDSKKYKISYNDGTIKTNKKVSESALVQLLGEKKITVEQVKNAGADVHKIENAVKTFRNIYNELFEKLNDSMLDNGYAPVEFRKDYFPHFTEQTTDSLLGKAAKLLGIDITNKNELPTDISGKSYQFKPGRTWFGNLLQRTTDVTEFNAKKGFEKYVRGVMDLIYHTEDIQNFRAFSNAVRGAYNDTEIKNQVLEINENTLLTELEKSEEIKRIYDLAKDKSHLSKFIEWLDNYINLLAGKKSINDRSSEKELNRKIYQTMTDIESRISANAIGGNVGVSLTNFAPLAQAWGEVKTHNLINGIWQTMKASLKHDNSFASESQFITRRRGIDSLTETTLEKITKPINKVLEFADNFTSEAIVRARYNQNLQQGMNTEQALEEADRYTAGLMADRGRGALPTQFSNKNPIAKMINMFQVEVNNQWSYYLKDLPKNLQEKANNNKAKVIADTAMAYTKIMVGSYLVNELLGALRGKSTRVLPDPIYIVKELIKGLSDDDDDNDDEAILDSLTEIAGNIPFISLPAALTADSFGLDVKDIGRIPISGSIPNISDIVSNLMDSNKTAGEKAKSIADELIDTVGSSLVLPYGGSQLKKTVKGLSLYNNEIPGSYTEKGDLRYTVDDSVGSKIQAGLFGAWANPYAQDYIDSGYKTIKKENIDEMVGLDMNSTEYREFKQGLSKAGTKKEDKLNYINASDLTPAQKNLVANNLDKDSKIKIDMDEYSNYNSYEEYKYATENPQKYSVITQIDNYDNYQSYKKQIANIKEMYSSDNGYTSAQRKSAVQSYIDSLDLDIPQKMMLEKMAGGYSIKNYTGYIQEYLDSTSLTESEKYYIWEELFN